MLSICPLPSHGGKSWFSRILAEHYKQVQRVIWAQGQQCVRAAMRQAFGPLESPGFLSDHFAENGAPVLCWFDECSGFSFSEYACL